MLVAHRSTQCVRPLLELLEPDESIKKSIKLALEKVNIAYYNSKAFITKEEEDETDLIKAAKGGDVDSVLQSAKDYVSKLSLSEHKSSIVLSFYINATDSEGMTALMHAAKNGHKAAVLNLVSVFAVIDEKDTNNMTASMHAAENGHHEIAELLSKDDDVVRLVGGIHFGWEGEPLRQLLSESQRVFTSN